MIIDVFKKIYNYTIISSIISFLLGLFAFFEADLAIKTVSIIFGLVFLVLGIVLTINYFINKNVKYIFSYSLLYGLLDIITGVAMMINYNVMYIIISLFISLNLLIEFISKMQIGLLFKKYEIKGWFIQLILACLLLICSVIVIVNPVEGALTITKIVSCIIIVSSLLNLVDCLIIREQAKEIKKSIKDILDL